MLFTLDDTNNLMIEDNNRRLDDTCKYDIEYYEKILKENTEIILDLAKFVYDRINLVQNMKLRGVLIYNLEVELTRAYLETTNKNPREEFKQDKSIIPEGMRIPKGMRNQEPLIAVYIKQSLEIYAQRIACIITEFMNEVYRRYKYAEAEQLPDKSILYAIFIEAKRACAKLGIHCVKEQELREAIVEKDPIVLKDFKIDCKIKEDNSIEEDIGITTLPYTITFHNVNKDYSSKKKEWGTYEMPVTKLDPVVWYNREYIDSIKRIKEQDDNKMRDRRPGETDEEYVAYLEEYFGKVK